MRFPEQQKNLPDFCRTPGYKIGRCVSIHECDYLLNILVSKTLTQQSITFLKLSQCENSRQESSETPSVCCARNDDSLVLRPDAGEGIHEKSLDAESAVNIAAPGANKDDSIIYKSSNSLLPRKNECGREKIENRIYSGQVSWASGFCWGGKSEMLRSSGLTNRLDEYFKRAKYFSKKVKA